MKRAVQGDLLTTDNPPLLPVSGGGRGNIRGEEVDGHNVLVCDPFSVLANNKALIVSMATCLTIGLCHSLVDLRCVSIP